MEIPLRQSRDQPGSRLRQSPTQCEASCAPPFVDTTVARSRSFQQHRAPHTQRCRHVHGDNGRNSQLRRLPQVIETRARGPRMEVKDVRARPFHDVLESRFARRAAIGCFSQSTRCIGPVSNDVEALPSVASGFTIGRGDDRPVDRMGQQFSCQITDVDFGATRRIGKIETCTMNDTQTSLLYGGATISSYA